MGLWPDANGAHLTFAKDRVLHYAYVPTAGEKIDGERRESRPLEQTVTHPTRSASIGDAQGSLHVVYNDEVTQQWRYGVLSAAGAWRSEGFNTEHEGVPTVLAVAKSGALQADIAGSGVVLRATRSSDGQWSAQTIARGAHAAMSSHYVLYQDAHDVVRLGAACW